MGDRRNDRQGPSPSSARVKGRPAPAAASTGVTHTPEGGPAPDLAGFTTMASIQHHATPGVVPVVHVGLPKDLALPGQRRAWLTLNPTQARHIAEALSQAAIAAIAQAAAETDHGAADRKKAIDDRAAAEAARFAEAYPRLAPAPQPEVET